MTSILLERFYLSRVNVMQKRSNTIKIHFNESADAASIDQGFHMEMKPA